MKNLEIFILQIFNRENTTFYFETIALFQKWLKCYSEVKEELSKFRMKWSSTFQTSILAELPQTASWPVCRKHYMSVSCLPGRKIKRDTFCVIQHCLKLCFHRVESDKILHCDPPASACWRTECKQVQKKRPWPHQLEYLPYLVAVIYLQLLTKGIINVLLQVVTDTGFKMQRHSCQMNQQQLLWL